MSDWLFAVHAPDGIDAAALATFEDDEIGRGTTVRHVTHGAASNNILVVDALNAKAQHIVRGACIKVYRTALSTTVPQTFFFIDKIETKVVGEDQDYKVLAASGTGTLWHLANAVLLDEPYTTAPIPRPDLRGGLEVEGMWVWGADEDGQRMGAICRRAYEEGRDQPSSVGDSPFYAVDADFNRTVDSNGVAWPAEGERYEKPIGTSVLEVFQDAVASGLYAQMTGKSGGRLNLSVYQSMGEDRSGAVFGAGTVRFVNLPNDTDNNIATDLTRQENDRQVSDLLVAGDEFVYERAGDAGANMPRWETISFPSNDPSLLQLVAERNLLARNLAIDAIRFPLARVGDDEANGVYYISPEAIGGHAWMNDTVTVHTGATSRDLSEADFPLAAWELRMEDDWEEWIEVGHVMIDSQRRAFEQAVTSIRHTLELCRPGSLGSAPVVRWEQQDFETYIVRDHGGAQVAGPVLNNGTTLALTVGTYGDRTPSAASPESARFMAWGLTEEGTWPPQITETAIGGGTLNISGVAYHPGGSGTRILFLRFYTGNLNLGFSGTQIGSTETLVSIPSSSPGVATPFSASFAIPSNARIFYLYSGTTGGATHSIELSGMLVTIGATAGLASVNDGHPDLIGTGIRAKRCDDKTHVKRTTTPTANDDWATQGYRLMTVWHQLDDLDNPTAILGSWLLVDNSTGAAVWLAMGGGDHEHTTPEITHPVVDHSAMGTDETFDASEGSDHQGILDDDLTVTLTGATAGQAAWLTLKLTDSGGPHAITWPGSVVWPGGVAPEPPDTDEVLVVSLFSYDGGSAWYGSYPGASTGFDEHQHDATYAPLEHTHSGEGGGLPLTAVVDGEPVLVWDEHDSLIAS